MAMGRRKDRARTPGLWIATNELPATGGHPFYQRLNRVLDDNAFDAFVEAQCAPFYAATRGRPSLTPGTYFRLLLIACATRRLPPSVASIDLGQSSRLIIVSSCYLSTCPTVF